MATVKFPYGRQTLSCNIPDENLLGVLRSRIHSYKPIADQQTLVEQAMENPIGSPKLEELVKDKENIVIIASDHTRPVPSKVIMPPMLAAIRRGNPKADITILIATGCHRETTVAELTDKFGPEIVAKEKIVIHDCLAADSLVSIGTLPSGGELKINRLAAEADLLLAEGFIEPHFFAGFSGGRKSVLPGIAARDSVMANHCAEFIAHPKARTGILQDNPIHADMLWAAEAAKLAYIVNVVLDEQKQVIYAVAGDAQQAHAAGCAFLQDWCRVAPKMADIAITTNGGYPLDQNVYQAVKGMTAAEATVKEGGVIIMLAQSGDGHGGEGFYRMLADEPDVEKIYGTILSRGRNETRPDQWQVQIFLRILRRAKVLYLSDMPDDMVRAMHMTPIHSLEEGLTLARAYLQNPNATVTAIPDGVGVMVTE